MVKFSERLAAVIKQLGYSTNAFEKEVGVSTGTFAKAISKGSDVNSSTLQLIGSKFPQINIGWLVTGNGEPLESSHIISKVITEKPPSDLQRKVNFLMEQVQDMSKTLYEVSQKTEKHEEQLKQLMGK